MPRKIPCSTTTPFRIAVSAKTFKGEFENGRPHLSSIKFLGNHQCPISDEMMHAALEIKLPNYANVIVSTDEILQSIFLEGRPSEELETV
jgi:hypothetical protein